MERAASYILFFLRFVDIQMVEEPLVGIKWLLIDAAGTIHTSTKTLNLELELCVFLETEEGKTEIVYAPLNRTHKHISRLGYWQDQYLENGKDSEKQSW